jgi:hypothetical protein
MDDRWCSVEESAEQLGVGRDAVYSWFTTKSLPANRVDTCWQLSKPGVDESVGAAGPSGLGSTEGADR